MSNEQITQHFLEEIQKRIVNPAKNKNEHRVRAIIDRIKNHREKMIDSYVNKINEMTTSGEMVFANAQEATKFRFDFARQAGQVIDSCVVTLEESISS